MTGPRPREEEGKRAGKVQVCEIMSYLHSAGFELLVKQCAGGAPPPLAENLQKVPLSTRHVYEILSTCRAVGRGRLRSGRCRPNLAKGS